MHPEKAARPRHHLPPLSPTPVCHQARARARACAAAAATAAAGVAATLLALLVVGVPLVAIAPTPAAGAEPAPPLRPIPDGLVVLTVDDGNRSDITVVAPMVKRFGFGASFYITEGLGFLKNPDNYVNWGHVKQIHEMGFEIGNHTQHHRGVAGLGREELLVSLRHIDRRCAEHGIAQPTTFAYPGFGHSQRAAETLAEHGFAFARRGVRPEFPDGGRGARGPAYDPAVDHPLLIPTTGYAGPEWGMEDLEWAVDQAVDGKIAVLCFHGVPAVEHPWVHTDPADLERYLEYLKERECTVIALRDLVNYVDPSVRPDEPYAAIEERARTPQVLRAEVADNPLLPGSVAPRLSWQLAPGYRQTAYQVRAARSAAALEAGSGGLWDSGRVPSARSAGIAYRGRSLGAGETFFWQVRTWDDKGRPGPWSPPARAGAGANRRADAAGIDPRRRPAPAGRLLGGGGPRWVEGRLGRGLDFSGQRTVRVPDYPGLSPDAALTLSAWARPAATPDGWMEIYRKEDGGARQLLALGRTGEVWGLWAGMGIGGRYVEVGAPVDPAALRDGAWHHLAATYDGGAVRLFVDGKTVLERGARGGLTGGGYPGSPAFIGSFGGDAEIFRGGLDDVRVYRRALSPAEIGRLAAGEAEVATDDLAGHWPLDGDLTNAATVADAPRPQHRVVIIGGTLAAGDVAHGHLEAELTAARPGHDLTFRNLGWPADNVFGEARAEFGSGVNTRSWQPPKGRGAEFGFETLLRQVREANPATVVVAYGAEVASGEQADPAQFRAGLERLLDALGEAAGAPRLVLLTPVKRESAGRELPDPSPLNTRLTAAARVIKEVGAARGFPVFDLSGVVGGGGAAGAEAALTTDGLHLNAEGYRRLAAEVVKQAGPPPPRWEVHLDAASGTVASAEGTDPARAAATRLGIRFTTTDHRLPSGLPGAPPRRLVVEGLPAGDYELQIDGRKIAAAPAETWAKGVALTSGPAHRQAAALREKIAEKNKTYQHRIRPQNLTYIFLFRRHEMGHLAYEVGEFDRLVEGLEEEIAQLRQPRPHRYELVRAEPWKAPRDYPDHEVPQNIPAPDVAAELAAFKIPEGFAINLFAREPMVANPININWDGQGRMWVATSAIYPHLKPGREPDDRILILEDTDRDGRADRVTEFADGLLVPHSVLPDGRGGAYVTASTEVLHLQDVDGDGRADRRRVLFSGFGNADVHHMIHGLRWSPGGDVNFLQSIYINSYVDTPWGPRRLNGSGVWHLRPEKLRLEVFARGMVNPWGFAYDRWGQSFGTDGAGGDGIHYVFPGAAFRTAVGAPRVFRGLNPGKPKACGLEVLSGRHLPEAWRGNLLTNDFRANRTVRYVLSDDGSGYGARQVEEVIVSSHRSFRPVDIKMGPDGAVYIVDWYNPIIDHGEVDFHHPLRDHQHGRIWRLTAVGQPLVAPPKIAGAPVTDLLEALRLPEQWTRDQARRELAGRGAEVVLHTFGHWLAALGPGEPGFEHLRLEALWLHQSLRSPAPDLLRAVLRSPEPRARAAAVRVLAEWRSELPGGLGLELLRAAVADPHPRVRLEAVNACRAAGTAAAAEVALRAVDHPLDANLDYAAWLAARHLEPHWLPELAAGKAVFGGDANRVGFALRAAESPEAIAELGALCREGKIAPENLGNACQLLARLGGPAEVATALDHAAATAAEHPDRSTGILAALAEGAAQGRPGPGISAAAKILPLLRHGNAALRTAALQVAGRWRVVGAGPIITAAANNPGTDRGERLAAARALLWWSGSETLPPALRKLATDRPPAVRATAAAAWASQDPTGAAGPAVAVLAALAEDGDALADAELLFTAFLDRADGPGQLAGALEGKSLAPAVAAAGLRAAGTAGRDVATLVAALTAAGGLQPVAALNPAERRQLLEDVDRLGDARRGGEVYRRSALGCVTCHAVRGAGGQVGPELGSIGVTSPPAFILESLLNPSSNIKEGYQTVLLHTRGGGVTAGVLQRKTETDVLVRTPAGNVVAVPLDSIERTENSPVSLMPPGLTAAVRRDELVDLMAYLLSLGTE